MSDTIAPEQTGFELERFQWSATTASRSRAAGSACAGAASCAPC